MKTRSRPHKGTIREECEDEEAVGEGGRKGIEGTFSRRCSALSGAKKRCPYRERKDENVGDTFQPHIPRIVEGYSKPRGKTLERVACFEHVCAKQGFFCWRCRCGGDDVRIYKRDCAYYGVIVYLAGTGKRSFQWYRESLAGFGHSDFVAFPASCRLYCFGG